MEIREVERNGAFLTLDVDGKIRDFFIISEKKEFSTYSSSLVKAGECISFSVKLAEILDKKCNTYGLDLRFGSQYEYFRGWFGFEFSIGFKELENPAKKNK